MKGIPSFQLAAMENISRSLDSAIKATGHFRESAFSFNQIFEEARKTL
ncbi:MAG: hypothetical protein U5K35_06695 [Rhodohalobacter sp.]|nr:hypothetical protein [Rhodohalobacter sp.]